MSASPTTDLKRWADAYGKEAGVWSVANAVDHNTFQESINTYLQGTPDDVFTWFAGFRMAQFAENGLITDLTDDWPIDGLNDSFKEASTAPGRQQYFVPVHYYPWAVFYRKSRLRKNGWEAAHDKTTTFHGRSWTTCRARASLRSPSATRTGGPRWAPSTSSTCASTASTST